MVTINTSDDLIRVVRENPEFRDAMRRELLTEELLELPRRFAEYTRESDRRWEANDQRWEANDRRLDRMEKDIGDLKGISLETRLYNRGLSSIATLLKVRNSRRVRVAEQDDNSVVFNKAIHEAEDQDVLSEREYDRLLDTDMIVQCNRRDSTQTIYVAIEATYGVTNRDIVQVKGSESALRKVFPDAEIHPALYFVNDLPDGIRKRCGDENIHLIQVDNLR